MRRPVDAARIEAFMRALGNAVQQEYVVYLVGGATAVLNRWRDSTIDVDIALVGEADEILRALPSIKNELELNVELASPGDFVPLPTGWEHRAISIGAKGAVAYFHFDPYSQALAKLERAHEHDLLDVGRMIETGLVDRARLAACFEEIERDLYRFPAVDPAAFRRRVKSAVSGG